MPIFDSFRSMKKIKKIGYREEGQIFGMPWKSFWIFEDGEVAVGSDNFWFQVRIVNKINGLIEAYNKIASLNRRKG